MLKETIKKFIPKFLISQYHLLLTFLGALIYGFPSRKLKIIGITGTKGKTTTVELIKKILEEAGHKTASISSIKFTLGEKEWPNDLKMTMPGRFKIHKFLRQAVSSKCEYAVFEVTSEGILQYRHRFINFEAVVFTNLSPEHIERHGSFEKYRQAKAELFRACKKTHILNIDDENTKYFLKFLAKEKWGYGLKIFNFQCPISNEFSNSNFQTITAEKYQTLNNGIKFFIKNIEFNLSLIGEFNIYNALAAITIGMSQGISLEVCQEALKKFKGVSGRMEMIIKEPFKVIVDYAHTADSLEKVYQTLKSVNPTNLICVLGSAGGGRDKWKRPEMGKVAAKYCDEIILTNEDPYDENPCQILSEIKSGIFNFQFSISNFHEILDRREAIHKALELANIGDVVMITGKGCECWMCVANGGKIPWSDKKIVEEEIKNMGPVLR